MAGKTRKRKNKLKQNLKFEFYGILLLALFIIELSKKGEVGFIFNSFFRLLVGSWDFVLGLIGIYIALYMMVKRMFPIAFTMRKIGLLLIFFAVLLYNHYDFVNQLQQNGQYTDVNVLKATWQALSNERTTRVPIEVGGGIIGAILYIISHYLFADLGTKVVIITLGLVGFLLSFHFSYVDFLRKIKAVFMAKLNSISEKIKEFIFLLGANKGKKAQLYDENTENEYDSYPKDISEPIIHDFMDRAHDQLPQKKQIENQVNYFDLDDEDSNDIDINGVPYEQLREEEENYSIPPFKILNRPSIIDQGNEVRDITKNAKKLEATLESFGVKARVTQINRGPAVTRYEIQPDIGVKVSKVVNLSDDIALSLAAKDIRIEAPIPGKAAIGIEVPNSEIAIVTLREVLESVQFYDSKSKLSIALGRDITGEPIIGDLAKMPHLLVAGATGSGKSVCVNSIITSILYNAKPSEVKFLMIDPKVVELNVYNGIPHLLTPVVTNPKRASKALKMIVSEMEKRYEKFAEKNARDIERYNAIIRNEALETDQKAQFLPYIVVIIDELADLMMVAPNDVEDAIIRLAQKARAAGIHLIVATQRPSVDVITGLIKANIPSRIAFGVSSQIDSRTIIDMGGAEKLLGRGDMLFLPVGFSKPIRVQGAFISDIEVESVVSYVKEQQAANYQEELIPELNQEHDNDNDLVEDEYFYDAVKLILENNQASVSLLQRRLRIGYTRAARLIDEMEAKGIVGPYEGSKPRKVLITPEQYQRMSS